MTPQQIAVQAKQYWKEHYPESYRTLKQYNQLESEALATGKLTRQEMDAQRAVGLSELEAWIASREYFVLRDPLLEWSPPEEPEPKK